MNIEQSIQKSPYLFYSVLLHVLVLVLLVMSVNLSSKNIVAEKGDSQMQIIQAAIVNTHTPKIPKILPKPIAAVQQKPQLQQKPQQQKISIPDHSLQQNQIRQQLLADITHQKKLQHIKKQKAVAAAFEKQMKQLAAKSLVQQMQQEQNRVTALHERKLQGIVDHYRALILQVISQNWRVPGIPDKNLSAELLIHLAPGGTVLDVQIAKSSGDAGLDHSAQTAVFRSSPLPVPTHPDEFEPFRQFILKVRPEDIQG